MSIRSRTIFAILLASSLAFAEGTRTWEQSKFDELVKGTPKGVAIRSNGGLELAPSLKTLYTSPSTYIWAIAADSAGNAIVVVGLPHSVRQRQQTAVLRGASDGLESLSV